jgi:phage head maturation protease
MIRFTSDQVTVRAAADDATDTTGERRIDAIAVPYNTWASVSTGQDVMFKPGSLPEDGKNPRVFMYHDSTKVVGSVVERVGTEEAMLASMKISRTALGDEALVLAADGVMDVSVGVNILEATEDAQGRLIVTSAEWLELSLVPIPAFAGATITDVAASAETNSDTPDTQEETTETVEETTVEATPAAEAVEAAAIPTAPIPAAPKREFAMPTPGEYLAAMHIGGATFAKVNEAYNAARLKGQSALEAAAGDIATTNTPGLLPVPVLGPLVQDLNFIRPVVTAFGARAYPDGGAQKTFVRPTITTHTLASAQAAEFDPVAARTMVIASNVVSKTTVSGQVTLSQQDIDFTSPAALQLILQDLMGEYMIATDNIAADALLAAATTSDTWDLSPEGLIDSIYTAAYDASINTNMFIDTAVISVDVWKQLGSLVDDTNRPIFPAIGAPGLLGMNTLGAGNATSWSGMNPLGLQVVVDANLPAKSFVITNASKAFELYEAQRGMMSVENPGTLSRTFSYYGYFSTFAAIPSMIRKIVQA